MEWNIVFINWKDGTFCVYLVGVMLSFVFCWLEFDTVPVIIRDREIGRGECYWIGIIETLLEILPLFKSIMEYFSLNL